jgi:hypothetical protein
VDVVARQYSTGGKQKLCGIRLRGNIYLRRMLIHGARPVLFRLKYDTGGFGQWVHQLTQQPEIAVERLRKGVIFGWHQSLDVDHGTRMHCFLHCENAGKPLSVNFVSS